MILEKIIKKIFPKGNPLKFENIFNIDLDKTKYDREEKDFSIHIARQCLEYQNFYCKGKGICKNFSCPLNKKYERR